MKGITAFDTCSGHDEPPLVRDGGRSFTGGTSIRGSRNVRFDVKGAKGDCDWLEMDGKSR